MQESYSQALKYSTIKYTNAFKYAELSDPSEYMKLFDEMVNMSQNWKLQLNLKMIYFLNTHVVLYNMVLSVKNGEGNQDFITGNSNTLSNHVKGIKTSSSE